jgi:putative Mg2+ transporter-C (MgtC) family protein
MFATKRHHTMMRCSENNSFAAIASGGSCSRNQFQRVISERIRPGRCWIPQTTGSTLARCVRYRSRMDVISIPVDNWSLALRLGLAALLGGILGLNREMALKPAGMRTHALVSLGAALATVTGLALTADEAAAGRIIQGIVAGIGFIGSGVILHRRDNHTVEGLTTAASIWVIAATGVAVGAGLWRAALIVVVISLLLLVIGSPIDRLVHQWSRTPNQE